MNRSMRLLLDKGADANAVDGTGKSAICYAAGRGFPAVVRRLLDSGVDVNKRYGNDLTVLMWAAGYTEEAGTADMDEIIKLLSSAVRISTTATIAAARR